MSGQTLTDRIAAAQYQLTGSDMARAVCKATTHEVMAPKKKHLECKCAPHPRLRRTALHCTALVWCAEPLRSSHVHHPAHSPTMRERCVVVVFVGGWSF